MLTSMHALLHPTRCIKCPSDTSLAAGCWHAAAVNAPQARCAVRRERQQRFASSQPAQRACRQPGSQRGQQRTTCLGDDAGGAGETPDEPSPLDSIREDSSGAQPSGSGSSGGSGGGSLADASGGVAPSAWHAPPEAEGPMADSTLRSELQQRARRLQALDEFREHMQREDTDIDLLHCALLIAKHAHPDLDDAACRHEIETLADGVWETLPEDPVPLRIVRAINHHLYAVHGFRGNTTSYYDPNNSCINKVLENRAGIPISLSLLYMSVAEKCGLPMVGINLPGHFMLAPAAEEVEVLVDAFHGGDVCFLEDAAEVLARVHGVEPGMVVIHPGVLERRNENAVTPRKFLARMLHNLKGIYVQSHQPENILAIVQYLRATLPEATAEIRDEGFVLYALERHSESADVLREYLAADPDAIDADEVRKMLKQLSRVSLDDPPAPE